ncbi:hypothetical protein ANCCAN_20997, partial [Ancylostoma caninum]
MLVITGLLLVSLSSVTSMDFVESQASSFEDSMDASTTERPLFEPLPPLPDMTSVQRVPGPPGMATLMVARKSSQFFLQNYVLIILKIFNSMKIFL